MSARLLPVLLAAACIASPAFAQSKKAAQPDPSMNVAPAAPKKFPIDMQWSLVGFGNHTIPSDKPTLMIDGQFRARGFGGCNAFSATAIPQPGQRMAVGPIAQTKKSCDKGLDEFERAFLIAFRTAVVWDIKNGQLIFAGQGGELHFERGL